MGRVFLPQNLQTQRGASVDNFQDISGWSPAVTADTINFKVGSQGGKFTNITAGEETIFAKSISLPLANTNKQFSLWIYVSEEDWKNLSSVQLYISPLAAWWNSYIWSDLPISRMYPGWNLWILEPSDFFNVGDVDINSTMVKLIIRIWPKTGKITSVTFGEIRGDTFSSPRVVFTFDDAYASVYNNAFTYMESKGVKGTAYVVPNLINTANHMTLAQLQELYDAGWDIANHTLSHASLSMLTDELVTTGGDDVAQEIAGCAEWLNSKGFDRASNHLAYPAGGYHNTIEFLSLIKQSGVITARTSGEGFMLGEYIQNNVNSMKLPSQTIYSTTHTLQDVKNTITETKRRGATVILQFHSILGSPAQAIEWATSDFQSLIDFIVDSKTKTATVDEWYNSLSNPRYTSIPISRAI
jgi:peptidoglycan/xylan/chitin deacetylase (PgdA/CDA1 family)